MSERALRGVLDTSVVVDLGRADPSELPVETAITAITMAELTAGPLATDDAAERARRQDRLLRTEALFDPLPFDADAARAFGSVSSAVRASGRQPRGRAMDLFIASIAFAHGLPLYTRNPVDFQGLGDLIEIVPVP